MGAVILIFHWVKNWTNIANLSLRRGLVGWTELLSDSKSTHSFLKSIISAIWSNCVMKSSSHEEGNEERTF